jgi:hypothetical protein
MSAIVRIAIAALLRASLVSPQPGDVREFTILHINDFHARLVPDAAGLGGFARLEETRHCAWVANRDRPPGHVAVGHNTVAGQSLNEGMERYDCPACVRSLLWRCR